MGLVYLPSRFIININHSCNIGKYAHGFMDGMGDDDWVSDPPPKRIAFRFAWNHSQFRWDTVPRVRCLIVFFCQVIFSSLESIPWEMVNHHENKTTRWFNSWPFSSPSWSSLNPWKGHWSHKELPGTHHLGIFFSNHYVMAGQPTPLTYPSRNKAVTRAYYGFP